MSLVAELATLAFCCIGTCKLKTVRVSTYMGSDTHRP
jgi:hypothetical protein